MGPNIDTSERQEIVSPEAARINSVSRKIIGCALRVHSRVGPGLLESVYEACLAYELGKIGLKVETQVPLGLKYDEMQFDVGYRADMLVDDRVLVELKGCEAILSIHRAQLLSYLRLSDLHLGLLINFHTTQLKNGIVRIVNKL
jgi:GxxExxY protein